MTINKAIIIKNSKKINIPPKLFKLNGPGGEFVG
jgi:hypothetical protein